MTEILKVMGFIAGMAFLLLATGFLIWCIFEGVLFIKGRIEDELEDKRKKEANQ